MYWSYFWEFVKRNILTIVIMAVIAVVMPWTLFFIIPFVLITLRLQMAVWKVRHKYHNAQQSASESNYSGNQGKGKDGEVRIVQTEQTEQRVNNDVGEYVDFKEIKEENKQ